MMAQMTQMTLTNLMNHRHHPNQDQENEVRPGVMTEQPDLLAPGF